MDLKKRIERLERDRQPAVPVQPPNVARIRELTAEEFEEFYRQAMAEEENRRKQARSSST